MWIVDDRFACCPHEYACSQQRFARATFFVSAIAIPQLEGSTFAITIPQLSEEMLLRNRNSAIPQFRNHNFF
jgi:hypothetical protein